MPLYDRDSYDVERFYSSDDAPFYEYIDRHIGTVFSNSAAPHPTTIDPKRNSGYASSIIYEDPTLPTEGD